MNWCKFLFIVSVVQAQVAWAAGELMIFPTRIVFDKNKKSAQVDLTNTGSEVASYRITVQNKRMSETGEFSLAPTALPGELFADQIIQYSPRQVELSPGGGQTVRIILRKPADLAPGEYRTHLVFNRLPDSKKKSIDPAEKVEPNEIGVSIKALFGVSIPIIIQNGETSATGSMKNLKLIKSKADEPQVLQLQIERNGTKSLYGDLVVRFTPKSGSEEDLANLKGIAIYSPMPSRTLKVALQTSDGEKKLVAGKITAKFSETRDAGGKIITEATLDVP